MKNYKRIKKILSFALFGSLVATPILPMLSSCSTSTCSIEGENNVVVGFDYQYVAKSSNTQVDVYWIIPDGQEDLASIDEDGTLHPIAPGHITIFALLKSNNHVFDAKEVTIYAKPTSVEIKGTEDVRLGDSLQLTATVAPSTTYQGVLWRVLPDPLSKTPGTATIDKDTGIITPRSKGDIIVEAQSIVNPNCIGRQQVTIKSALPRQIEVVGPDYGTIGLESSFSVSVSPESEFDQVKWSVDDHEVASISPEGVLTGLKRGFVTVTAQSIYDELIVGTKTIYVYDPPQSISISGPSRIVASDAYAKYWPTVQPATALQNVKWFVSDRSVANITSDGILFPSKAGTVDVIAISLTSPDIKSSFTVNVTQPTFENDSWKNVISYAKQGFVTLKQHYNVETFVGLRRAIYINGEKEYVRVIGENHDFMDAERTKAVPLTFEFENLICDSIGKAIQTKADDDSEIWWSPTSESDLRQYLNSSIRDMLVVGMGLKVEDNPFTPVYKKTYDRHTKETYDLLETIWLPGISELTTPEEWHGFVDEGPKYAFYRDESGSMVSDLRIKRDAYNTPLTYWLRSNWMFDNDGCFMVVDHQGMILPRSYTETYGIAPCFCI